MALRPRYNVQRPWQTNKERLASEALATHTLPIRDVRGPEPTFDQLFPSRYGYEVEPPTIGDILQTDLNVPDYRAHASGVPADFASSSRPSGSGWW